MKFSLKNKEFNKKRLNIFDRKQSTSPNFKSLSKESLSKSKSPFDKNAKHNITISYDQMKTNFQQQNRSKSKQHNKFNISQLELSQIQEENGELINSNFSNYQNNLIKTQNKKILQNQLDSEVYNVKSQYKQRKHVILPLQKPIQSVYHEQQKSIRQNQLINTHNVQIQSNKIYHPSSQIVFQPINRRSASKSQSKQKQMQKVQQKISNNNFLPSSQLVKQYNYTINGNTFQPNQNNQKIKQQFSQMQRKNILFSTQINKLKQTIQQQNLQIKYLKNQKQIMESNQVLKYDSKEQSYKKDNLEKKRKQSSVNPTKNKHKNQQQNLQLQRQREQQTNNRLLQLYHILIQNQQKIKVLQQNQRSIFASALIYIEKVQNKLVEVVSIKYFKYKSFLQEKLKQFDKYIDKCSFLEDKLNLYSNTVRSVNQSLRLTKLKQQNIELQIKQSSIHKKSSQMQGFYMKKQNEKYIQNNKFNQKKQNQPKNYKQNYNNIQFHKYKQLQNNFENIQDSESDISSIKRVQYDYDEFQQKEDKKQLYVLSKNLQRKNSLQNNQESISSFLDQKYSHLVYKGSKRDKNHKNVQQEYKNRANYNLKQMYKQKPIEFYEQSSVRSQIYEIDDSNYDFYNSSINNAKNQQLEKLSPFQANKMFKNSYTKLNHIESRSRSFYQFQDNKSNEFIQNNQIYHGHKHKGQQFINQYQAKKNQDISFQSPHAQIKKQLISDTLQQEQARVICIIQQKNYKFPVECWIDQMGCLRKKNHTYLFDNQGNVLVTTESAFKKLCQQNVFRNIS